MVRIDHEQQGPERAAPKQFYIEEGLRDYLDGLEDRAYFYDSCEYDDMLEDDVPQPYYGESLYDYF